MYFPGKYKQIKIQNQNLNPRFSYLWTKKLCLNIRDNILTQMIEIHLSQSCENKKPFPLTIL